MIWACALPENNTPLPSDGGTAEGGSGLTGGASSGGKSGSSTGGTAGASTAGQGGSTAGSASGGTGQTGGSAGTGQTGGSGGSITGGSAGRGGTAGTGGTAAGAASGSGGAASGAGGSAGKATGGSAGSGSVDGCPADPLKTAPGTCGCGFPDVALCLVHRWSFEGNAMDSIGTAHGTVVGGAAYSAGGVTLAGGTSEQYVDLPDGILNGMTRGTFEGWTTWTGGTATWQRLFDFGSSDVAGGQGLGATYLFFTTRAAVTGNRPRAVFSLNGNVAGAEAVADGTATFPTGQAHVAVTLDGASIALYVNGAAQGTAAYTGSLDDVSDVNNWLGRSQYATDMEFAGTIHDFRIYVTARTSAQIAASFAAGANALPAQ